MENNSGSWKKTFIILLLIISILGGGIFYIYYYIPYGDSSVKSGQLNYIMHKGLIFKTYEGKLIQTGFKSRATGGMQSNEFEFSVDNEELAHKLMKLTGKDVILHYKEYFGALPWRGFTNYIVDSIISAQEDSESIH
ncbi:MAG: hypothetical protein J6581_04970 [Apibacter sp.]|nr:hypothetical protein [Apibacter sp.]